MRNRRRDPVSGWRSCPVCQNADGTPKRAYPTNRQAKRIRRIMQADGVRVYKCPTGDGYHLGHIPQAVLEGHITRGEIYRG